MSSITTAISQKYWEIKMDQFHQTSGEIDAKLFCIKMVERCKP